jgi:hypothetical protein
MTRIDPSNTVARINEAATNLQSATMLVRLGRYRDGIDRARVALEQSQQAKQSVMVAPALGFFAGQLAIAQAEIGELRPAEASAAEARQLVEFGTREMAAESFERAITRETIANVDYAVPAANGDYQKVHALAEAALHRLEPLKPRNAGDKRDLNGLLLDAYFTMAQASYRQKNSLLAEKEIQEAIRYRAMLPNLSTESARAASEERVLLGMIKVQEQRLEDGWKTIEPEIKVQRDLKARGTDDVMQQIQLATTLYAAALTQARADSERSVAWLDESAAILEALPAQVKKCRSWREVRGWVADEKKARL